MLEGVKIICERIRVFPEEVPKWKHFMNTQVTEMLTPEEHESIKEALRDHFRRDFNARVLDMLNDSGVKSDPRKPRFSNAQVTAEAVKHEWTIESQPVMYKHTK